MKNFIESVNKNVQKLLKPEVALQKPHANLVSQLLQTDKSMCFPSTCPYHTSRLVRMFGQQTKVESS